MGQRPPQWEILGPPLGSETLVIRMCIIHLVAVIFC